MHEFVKSSEGEKNNGLKEICNKTNSFCLATRVAVDTLGLCRLSVELAGSFSYLQSLCCIFLVLIGINRMLKLLLYFIRNLMHGVKLM